MKFFKFFFAIAVAAIGLSAISCSSDDKEETQPTIVGIWELQAGPDVDPDDVGELLEFTADGKFYTLDKKTKNREEPGGEYKLSGNKLVATLNDEDGTKVTEITIKRLTQTDLELMQFDQETGKNATALYKRVK